MPTSKTIVINRKSLIDTLKDIQEMIGGFSDSTIISAIDDVIKEINNF